MIIIKILLAFFIPPVGAALQVGITTHFWINLALSLLLWFPGMLHAMWLIFTDQQG